MVRWMWIWDSRVMLDCGYWDVNEQCARRFIFPIPNFHLFLEFVVAILYQYNLPGDSPTRMKVCRDMYSWLSAIVGYWLLISLVLSCSWWWKWENETECAYDWAWAPWIVWKGGLWGSYCCKCDNCLLPLRLTLVPSEHLVKFTCGVGVKRWAKNNFSKGKHSLAHLINSSLTKRAIPAPKSKLTLNSYTSYRLSQLVEFWERHVFRTDWRCTA